MHFHSLRTSWVFALGLLALGACTDSPAQKYDALFGPPRTSTITPDSIDGVWGGTASSSGFTFDVRFDVSPDSLEAANRCHFPDNSQLTVGVTVAATSSNTDIKVQESQSASAKANGFECRVDASPRDLQATLSGTNLILTDPNGGTSLSLIKISD
jgi:hypothetical protein